jgi:hypothetical protein
MNWHEQLQRLVDSTAGALSLSNRRLVLNERARLPAAMDRWPSGGLFEPKPALRAGSSERRRWRDPSPIDALYRARRGVTRTTTPYRR